MAQEPKFERQLAHRYALATFSVLFSDQHSIHLDLYRFVNAHSP